MYSLLRVSVLLWPLSRTAVLNRWARFSLQGTCGNVWKSMTVTTEEMVLKLSGKRPRMLINTLQCRDRTAPLHNKYVSTPDISDAEVEKSWARQCIYTHTETITNAVTHIYLFFNLCQKLWNHTELSTQHCRVHPTLFHSHICNSFLWQWETWLLLSTIHIFISSIQEYTSTGFRAANPWSKKNKPPN